MRRRTQVILLLAAIPIAVSFLASREWITANYSRGLFATFQPLLVPVTGAIALPITGVMLILIGLAVVALIVVRWRRGRREEKTRIQLLKAGGRQALVVLVVTYAVFLTTWGLGYRQMRIEDRWQIASLEPDDRDLLAFTEALMPILKRPPPLDERDEERALAAIREALADIAEKQEGWRPAVPRRVKFLPAGSLMTFRVTGIASPFLLEPNVDAGLPLVDRVAVSAHELAHSVGYNGEADADLVGHTAGFHADDAFARYCVAIRTFKQLSWDLDLGRWIAFRDALPDLAQIDISGEAKAVQKFEIEQVSDVTDKVYDTYLKTQGVEGGRRDYQRGIELLVRAWRAGRLRLPD